MSATQPPILILTQGFAGDRLGARLAPALQERFPDRELIGLGGDRMEAAGVRLLARADAISAMGYSGLIPKLPTILRTVLQTASRSRHPVPGCVVAVDVWQPLRGLHRFGPHLKDLPHVCYLPPGPNFIGQSRVHTAASKAFAALITPFAHQARLYEAAGGRVRMAAHAGLQAVRDEAVPLRFDRREPILALLPGSRELEIWNSLPVQVVAAERVRKRYPELTPVVCCASERVEAEVRCRFPTLRTERNARQTMARARAAIICSGTASLEAAVLGCPGVVTYHGSRLQQWEWHRFHVKPLARLRELGIASPYVALPNILAGQELYPEFLDLPAEQISEGLLRVLAQDPAALSHSLQQVTDSLAWEDAGTVVAEEVERCLTR